MNRYYRRRVYTKRKRRVAGMVIGVVLGVLAALCSVLFCIVWSWSPGVVEPYYDSDGNVLAGSVSEIVKVEIGGMEQGMIVKGKDMDNPVLLFLHGGPGNPQYVLFHDIGLEDHFTVCWWDQRGSGMSYNSGLDPGSITLDLMLSDVFEVTDYLRGRFGKDKIYLMGQSFGSFLGIHAAAQRPELYEAYIGISQVTNQLESEKMGYESMMSIAQAEGDEKSARKLGKYELGGADTITSGYLMLRSNTMEKQGTGVFHNSKSTFEYAIMPLMKAREYKLSDKYGYLAGSLFMLKTPLNDAQFETNIMETIPEVDVPVYIFHGIYDRVASYDLSREYFEALRAPAKEFYTFEGSAHSPHMEEPQRILQIVKEDILGL